MPALDGEIIIITGATSGFGEATARQCAVLGAKLILIGRRQDRLVTLQEELGKNCAHIIALDIRNAAAIHHAIATLPADFRAITALINNAGLALGLKPAHQCDLDDWQQMVDTNISGLMTMTRAILPGMVERNRGYIINIGSTAGHYPYPGGNVYGATKAFVEQFSLNLRADLLGTAVRVTVIAPGMAHTEFSNIRFKGDDKQADDVYKGLIPLSPDDIAGTITWCLSRPAHMNVNTIEIMPVSQASGPLAVSRKAV